VAAPLRLRLADAGHARSVGQCQLRILCKKGTVSATAIKPRHGDGKPLATKDLKATASATRAPLLQVLSAPAVCDGLCKS